MEFNDVKLSGYAEQKVGDIYDRCRETCKKKYDTLLMDMINCTQNEREGCLRNSAIDTRYLDEETIGMLRGSGLVEFIDTSLLGITAYGILYVETKRGFPATNNLVEGIQSKYFVTSQNTPISPKGRIVLMSAVALRCFSKDCSIDMRSQKDVRDEWWEIFNKVSEYLVSKGVIEEKNSLANYKSKSEIEDKASDVIRHTDKLPRQTSGIFSKSGSNQYWLEVSTPVGGIDINRLATVMKRVLGDAINSENYQEYADWCNSLCSDEGFQVESSFADNRYLSCSYDDEIFKAFETAASLIIG